MNVRIGDVRSVSWCVCQGEWVLMSEAMSEVRAVDCKRECMSWITPCIRNLVGLGLGLGLDVTSQQYVLVRERYASNKRGIMGRQTVCLLLTVTRELLQSHNHTHLYVSCTEYSVRSKQKRNHGKAD